MLNFDEVPEFAKDLKALKKKWRSLPSDIDDAKLQIEALYGTILQGEALKEFREGFFGTKRATILQTGDGYEVVKMRLDCASLGTDKKTRLVFVAVIAKNTVRLVELFAKNANEREAARRLRRYLP